MYLEIGQKKVFASALDWPGWSRSGRDEASALEALYEWGPRYARALRSARLGFRAPADVSALRVVERLKGGAGTDFGAPGVPASSDSQPVDAAELRRLQSVLRGCWRAFDAAVEAAQGKSLRTGPRGGGRALARIVRHVLEADAAYLGQVGWKFKPDETADPGEELRRTRQAILQALPAAARGELPARGPRGGLRWSARFYVRYSAWHVLDHAWEIEDRAT